MNRNDQERIMQELNEVTLRQAMSGQKKAFKSLYDWYIPFVWKIAIKMCQNKEHAEEVVQETFVRIHSSLSKFRSVSSLSTWIYKIVYNTTLAHLSKSNKSQVHDSYEDRFEGPYRADSYEERELMDKILSQLTPQERFLLIAREIDDLSFEEISSITSESSGALRTKLSRLKDRIRERFAIEPVVKEAV
jgi:RNA polymerase sigma-70 factor (ECF subfamily)